MYLYISGKETPHKNRLTKYNLVIIYDRETKTLHEATEVNKNKLNQDELSKRCLSPVGEVKRPIYIRDKNTYRSPRSVLPYLSKNEQTDLLNKLEEKYGMIEPDWQENHDNDIRSNTGIKVLWPNNSKSHFRLSISKPVL